MEEFDVAHWKNEISKVGEFVGFDVDVGKKAMVSSVECPSEVGVHDRHECVSRVVPQVVVYGEEYESGGETPEPNQLMIWYPVFFFRCSK